MKKTITLLFWTVLGLCFAQGQTPTEMPQFTDELSVMTNPKVNMDFQTAVVSHKGSIYFGFVDGALNGCITKKDKNGVVTTTIVMTGVLEDPHNSVSIGIDAEGYIHWTGDMHQNAAKYFRSDKPDNISTFTKLDGNVANGGIWGPDGVSYGRFIQSRKGTLFFISRQRVAQVNDGWVPGGQGGHIQVYNTDTKRWNQLGSLDYSFLSDKGRTITGGGDALHQTKVVFWDNSGAGARPNNGYQGYKIRIVFDKNNRMHMVWNVAKNPVRPTVADNHTHLMYAYSDDEGLTWKKSNGSPLTLPITTENGDLVYMEDPNVDAQRMFNGCYIALTSDNKPIILQWSYSRNLMIFKHNGSDWVNESAVWSVGWPGEAFTDDNGWITTMDGARWKRSNDNGKTLQAYERVSPSRGSSVHSMDMPYLLESGKLRYVEEIGATSTVRTLAFNNSAPGQVEAPEITPLSGNAVAGAANVTIVSNILDATIRYTTDGSNPTETNGMLYTAPFSLTAATVSSKTVRAIAYKPGKVSSRVTSSQIVVNLGLDTQAPSVPTALAATGITFTSFTLSWNPSVDNSGIVPTYDVYNGTVLVGTTTSTSFALMGLTPATNYAMSVKAKDGTTPPNVSAASAVLDVSTNSTEASILLTTSSPTMDGIKDVHYKSPTYPFNNVIGVVANKNDLSGSWTSTFDKDNLYFFVEVTDNILNTSAPNWFENDGIEFYIDATNRRGTMYENTDFQLSYTFGDTQIRERKRAASTAGMEVVKVNTPTGYRLEVKMPFSVLGITTPKNAQKIGIDLMLVDNDNGKWKGKLAWFNTQDDSWQNPSKFGTATLSAPDVEAPTVPMALVASTITQNSFTLNWNASTDNSGLPPTYQVFSGSTLLPTTTSTSLIISTLQPATAYVVTVRARDAAGNISVASAPLTVTTLAVDNQAPTVPMGLVVSSVSPTGFVLSWTASTDNVGVTAYEVFRDGVLLGTTLTTTITLTGLLPGTTYNMSVKAKDAAGNTSAASAVLAASTAVITAVTPTSSSQANLRLFPNPAFTYEEVHVLLEGFDQKPVSLTVTDLLGNLQTVINMDKRTSIVLKVNTFLSGVYLVSATNGVTKLVQKLVIR